MRTTLNLDERLLIAAKARARQRGTTLSSAISELALAGLAAEQSLLPDDTTLAEPRIELSGLSGHRQVTDFRLVNLAARHSTALVTFDRALPATLMADDRKHVHLLG